MILQKLQQNVESIQQDVEKACQISQRPIDSVTIICVTKSVDNETTKQVVDLGFSHLAENRMEKLLEKQAYLANYKTIKWHFIGNLQRRKVKTVINQIDYFHALDKISLAEEIQKRALSKIKCFVQVNVSGEMTKQGISPDDLLHFIKDLKDFDRIEVVGLMTMAPIDSNLDELSHYFNQLKKLQQEIASKNLDYAPCTELSMGMSQDFMPAIESGATFVRIGSRFFES
ncbi:YggS family pyridoxal phosphate-dependent enzyme [Vagococcus bubulae]|uniref:YggS family pyridoxal phosphate-dependent enzyme n=1 Tax=Vagococcus bubulae TaxID=1977868 RepID=UPI001FB4B3BF|nr:YggS family pyridoxal phosphate-dependent enzyme [Vagococcus bubulae]